jgi:subtilisin family serine protease
VNTVDIAAPGSNVLSTWLGTRTQKLSGTSMAAPVVAGAAALLKAAHPEWTAKEIKARLMETVDPISALKTRVMSGGRLNVGKALAD